MDCNELLAQLMEDRPADTASPPTTIPIETVSSRDINHKRARLAALAAGGQAKLHFRYDMFLAPLTAALTTGKHCEWGHKHVEDLAPDSNENGGADMYCLRRNTRSPLKILRGKTLGVRVQKLAREKIAE